MVHLDNLAQLCWMALIIGSQGSHFGLSSGLRRGRVRILGHCDVFYLLFLRVHQLRFASPPILLPYP